MEGVAREGIFSRPRALLIGMLGVAPAVATAVAPAAATPRSPASTAPTAATAAPKAAAAKTGWKLQSTPNPKGEPSSYLQAVSCTSTRNCVAVGYATKSAVLGVSFAEIWDGKHWTTHPVPSPKGAMHTYLNDIACTSSRACIAAGYWANASAQEFTLAERWNGKIWSIQQPPSPHGATTVYLYGLSCTSSKACTAVGYYSSSSAFGASFAERWNGHKWAIQTMPSVKGAAHTYMNDLACTGSRACIAVGYSADSSGNEAALAERWNGKIWSIQQMPPVAGSQSTNFSSISCSSSSACFAVGSTDTGSGTGTGRIERWNGKRWTVQHISAPKGSVNSYLNDVSCSSSHACSAVGYYSKVPLVGASYAERWNGKAWTVQSIPSPARAKHTYAYSVSCPVTTDCEAIGDYTNSASNQLTLAARWTG